MVSKGTQTAIDVYTALAEKYPTDQAFLTHKNDFELLIAVILSAQCTDERVNKTTPALFDAYPTPQALAKAPIESIKTLIKSINFFNNKAANIKRASQQLIDKFHGVVPHTIDEMITLAGVGRKTANVMLCQAFNTPGVTVDTHVKRVTKRLGFHNLEDATKVELKLKKLWPDSIWSHFSTILILHGRDTCKAHKGSCDSCLVESLCKKRGVT